MNSRPSFASLAAGTMWTCICPPMFMLMRGPSMCSMALSASYLKLLCYKSHNKLLMCTEEEFFYTSLHRRWSRTVDEGPFCLLSKAKHKIPQTSSLIKKLFQRILAEGNQKGLQSPPCDPPLRHHGQLRLRAWSASIVHKKPYRKCRAFSKKPSTLIKQ